MERLKEGRIEGYPFPNSPLRGAGGETLAGKTTQIHPVIHWAVRPGTGDIRTVVIDAGHGGKDPGCSGSNSREKHIALAVAQGLAARLKAQHPGLQVILTRDEDVFIPLYERAAIANRAHADLFVSIHCNYMPGSSATRGSETYIMGLHTANHNLAVAKRENEAIRLEENYEQNYDYDLNSPEGHILLSMYQSAYLERSVRFAEKVEHHFHATAERKSRGVKQAGFVVLKETALPSALVEIGFLSSGEEETFLLSAAGQDRVADALAAAFADYKREVENGAFISISSLTVAPPVAVSPAAGGPSARPAQVPVAVANPPVATTPPPPTAADYRPATAAAITNEADFHPATVPASARPAGNPQKSPAATAAVADHRPAAPLRPVDSPTADAVRVAAPSSAPQARPAVLDREIMPANPTTNRTTNRGAVVPAAYREPTVAAVPAPYSPPAAAKRSPAPATGQATTPATAPAPESGGTAAPLSYAIQLAASRTPLRTDTPAWQALGYPVEVIQENGYYKYLCGGLQTPRQARAARLQINQGGFPEAYIVAYRGTERLSGAETFKLLQE